MTREEYIKDFNKQYQDLQKTVDNNFGGSCKVDYRMIISPKAACVHSMNFIDSSDTKGAYENNVKIFATVVPEWATSIFKLVAPARNVKTDATHKMELDQFNSYYEKHSEKCKPDNMWYASLELRFEKQEYNYYFRTGNDADESLTCIPFKEYEKARKLMDNAQTVKYNHNRNNKNVVFKINIIIQTRQN